MQTDFDLRAFLGLLRRRRWIIVLSVMLALVSAGAVIAVLKPVYSATALVLVDPGKKNLLESATGDSAGLSDSLRVDSEVELVRSENTLLAVATQMNLAGDPEFAPANGWRDKILSLLHLDPAPPPTAEDTLRGVIEQLHNMIGVQRRGLTFLIAVTAKSERPDFAARLANAVAESYIGEQLNAKVESIRASGRVIEARLAEAQSAVATSDQSFDAFVEQALAQISSETGRAALAQMRAELRTITAEGERKADAANRAAQGLALRDWATLAQNADDAAVTRLQDQRMALIGQLATAKAGSPAAIDLQRSLDALESQLSQEGQRAVTSLKSAVDRTSSRAMALRADMRKALLDSSLPSNVLTGIYALLQQAEIARTQYQTLLTRKSELANQEYLQVPDSRVVSAATAPLRPSFPAPNLILAGAGAAGLMLGIGLALLTENFVGGFVSEAQAEILLKVPVVSVVPKYRGAAKGSTPVGSAADGLVDAPLSAFSEAIRRVRVGIDYAVRRARRVNPGATRTGLVVMVSSAASGEGRSTLALSLARAYALSGRTTLLIDCDLRKPGLHRQMGLEPSSGLLDFLTRSGPDFDFASIMTMDPGSGAQVVLGARQSDVPTDQLIAGDSFARLILSARKNFDVVLLDTPPVGPVVDGLYLQAAADVVVFVVRWSSTPQQDVRNAVSNLSDAQPEPIPMLAVLNMQVGAPAADHRHRLHYTSPG